MPRFRLVSLVCLVGVLGCAAGDGNGDGGPGCTEIGCNSQLTITLAHSLPRDGDPHQILFEIPDHDIRCSIPAGAPGTESCFGLAFADVSWDDDTIELVLVEPFEATPENPEGTPFDNVRVTVTRGSEPIDEFDVPVEPGEPHQPNGEDCPPTCWDATGSGTIN